MGVRFLLGAQRDIIKFMPKSKISKRHQGVTLESVDSKLDLVLEQVDENTKDIKVMKGDINTIKDDIDIIKMDIELIKNDLRKKVNIDDFAALERRVALLEKRGR